MTFPASGGTSGYGVRFFPGSENPGSKLDYAALAGDPHLNSVVSICLNWYISTIHAAPACVKAKNDKNEKEVVHDHPLTRLLLKPNEWYAGSTLWAGTILSYRTHGSAYWFKVRNSLGEVVELWYVPHFQVRPLWDTDGQTFITGYEYRVNNKILRMKPEDVVQFRFGINPYNLRVGLNPVGGVTRSLAQKNASDTFGVSLLRNGAVPSAILTPKDPDQSFDNPALIKETIKKYTSGDMVGDILALESAVELQKLGYTPEEMALDKLDAMPTGLICAAMGLDPMVLGLPSANKTYSNFQEALEAVWEQAVMPMHANFGETLDLQLLNDDLMRNSGEPKPDPANETVEWDYSEVSALQPDVDALHARAREDFQSNLITRAQAKIAIGIDPAEDKSDDIYYADIAPPASGGYDEGFDPNAPSAANPAMTAVAQRKSFGKTWRDRSNGR